MAKLSKEKIELLESYVNRAKELMQETDEMRNQFERDFAAELSAKVYYASHLHRDIRDIVYDFENLLGLFDDYLEIRKPCTVPYPDPENMGALNFEEAVDVEVYLRISESGSLNRNDIEKWKDQLNWDLVSKNKNIIWSSDMISEFADLINWNIFSRTISSNVLSTDLIERFKDRWDWKELSWNNNLKLSFSLIDNYIDRWDWNGLISIFRYPDLMGYEFYNRYKTFIPQDKIRNSWFYNRIVLERKKELMLK